MSKKSPESSDRLEYLQNLVTEFQDTDREGRRSGKILVWDKSFFKKKDGIWSGQFGNRKCFSHSDITKIHVL